MKFEYLRTREEVQEIVELHNNQLNTVVLDTETTGLNPFVDRLTKVVMTGKNADHVVMFDAEFADELRLFLPQITLVLHNFRFDFNFLYRVDVDLMGINVRDTMLMHHLFDENKSHGLDAIVQENWQDKYKEEFWGKYKTFEEAPEADQLEYACKDAYYTLRLYKDMAAQVDPSLVEHVHRLAIQLYKTERDGINIDMEYLTSLGTELKGKIEGLKKAVREQLDVACYCVELDLWNDEKAKRKTDKGKARVSMPEFNFDSTQHLQRLLYGKLKLPAQRNRKTRQLTTDDAALSELGKLHPSVSMLQEYRGHQKVYTAFIEGTLEKMHEGRIFPSFNINGTVTGRISSSNPNMQQLPRDGGIRGIYVPDVGHRFLTCDYQQLEICLAAHFSNDPVLLELIHEGKSMHDHTAKECGIDRQAAKTVNFLTIYGGTEYRLSVVLGISLSEAGRILKRLWKAYAGLRDAIQECHRKVEAGEPILNPFGRKRRFPTDLQGKELERAKRQAFNALVQGTGADLTHWAFYTFAEQMERNDWGRAMFEVHDEIVGMPRNEFVDNTKELLESVMVESGRRIGLKVPLRVDCSDALTRWEK